MKKPNMLFILADDLGAWALGCAGNKYIRTPNIDSIASRGTLFENFFCVSPVCSQSRDSIVTGQIPSYHGVHDWIRSGNYNRDDAPEGIRSSNEFTPVDYAVNYLENHTTYMRELAANGYDCALSGKWHLGDSMRAPEGFSYWLVHGRGGGSYYAADIIRDGKASIENEYVTDIITDGALKYLDSYDGKKPFYLSVHYTAPHTPWARNEHPERFFEPYNDCTFDDQPNFDYYHTDQITSCEHGTGEKRNELLRGYYAAISAMDEGIGKILEKVDRIDGDTIIVFTGDNGMNLGHHGVWGKGNGTFPFNMYDTSVKVPFILSHPASHLPRGGKAKEMYSHYDLFPTLLEFAGITYNNSAMPGASFANAVFSGVEKTRDSVVIFDEYGPVRMIRSKTRKLVCRYPYGPDEYYNLEIDPNEEVNRIGEDRLNDEITAMRGELESWFVRYSKPECDGRSEGVMGMGQIERAGVFSGGKNRYNGGINLVRDIQKNQNH